MRFRLLLLLAFLPASLCAMVPSTDLIIPIAGRTAGADGKGIHTTVWLSNVTDQGSDLTLTFIPAAKPDARPLGIRLSVGPMQTIVHEVEEDLVAGSDGIGALRIQSPRPIAASARVYSRGGAIDDVGMVVNAIPVDHAIGTGESALIHANAGEARYKIYVVETRGLPLTLEISLLGKRGQHLGSRRVFVSARDSMSWALTDLFPGKWSELAAVRLTGINGSGTIIAAGNDISPRSGDFDAWEMQFQPGPRHRARWRELLAYSLTALALIFASVVTLRRRPGH